MTVSDRNRKIRLKVIKCQNGSAYNRMNLGEDIWAGIALPLLRERVRDLEFEDHNFMYFDTHEDLRSLADATVAQDPELILFPILQNSSNLYFTLRFVDLLKKRGATGKIGLFGDTGADMNYCLREYPVDFVVLGEEPSLLAVTDSLLSGREWRETPGIGFLNESSIIRRLPTPIADLDSLPFIERYGATEGVVPEVRRVFYKANMLGSRGCYARCTFCHETARVQSTPAYGWRGRSPENIVTEVQQVAETHGVTNFFFQDSNFCGPGQEGHDRTEKLAQLFKQLRMPIRFAINTRVNDVEHGLFTRLAEAGLDGVFLGVETFVDRRLRRYRKGLSITAARDAFRLFADLGIKLRLGIILIDHDSTPEEVLYDLRQFQHIGRQFPGLITNPNFLFNILAPKEDTPFGNEYLNSGPSTIRYPHAEHLRVMQLRTSPHMIQIEDSRVSATAELLRILGYEMMLQWTERHEEIVAAAFSPTQEAEQRAVDAHSWVMGIYDFAAAMAVRIAEEACQPLATFNASEFVIRGYDFVFRNFLEYNRKMLGERGLYLYTPTVDCTPKVLPHWLTNSDRDEWRSWLGGFGSLPANVEKSAHSPVTSNTSAPVP